MTPDEFSSCRRQPAGTSWLLLAILLAAAVASWCAGVRQAEVALAGDVRVGGNETTN